jgi:HSP20 family protein
MLFNKKLKESTEKIIKPFNEMESWINNENLEMEGQLSIDVYQNKNKIIIKSTIAGVKSEDLKISLHHDLLTIKGLRESEKNIREEDYLFKECYWGSFSRSIILPSEVDEKRVEAELENGILTISLYKTNPEKIEVKVKE